MVLLVGEHPLLRVLLGLVGCWFAVQGIRAGYVTLKTRQFPPALKRLDPLLARLGVPDDYYTVRRVMRTGLANIVAGVAIGFCGLALLFNAEPFAWIGAGLFVLLIIGSLSILLFDSPWKSDGKPKSPECRGHL